MKKLFLLVLLGGTLTATAQAQGHEEEMKAWQAYMTPGPVHQMLAKSDGNWTTETTMWMAPGAEPMKSKGTCTNSMTFGGRYQQSVFHGDFMGMPFEGQSTLAYDNAKKSFVSTWIDNMGTGIMVIEGKWDEATKSITFRGRATDPTTGKDMPVREVFTWKDANHQTMVMYMPDDKGKEYKTMEILFTRA